MSYTHPMIANLKHAAWNKEVADFLGHYQAMKDALEAAKLLAANIERGGVGSQTLVDNFHLCVDKV
jgi:hypothetical protein